MSSETTALPSFGEAQYYPSQQSNPSPAPSEDSSTTASEDDTARPASSRLSRPKMTSRKSSGSIIVSRGYSNSGVGEAYDAGDVRSMSPRRNSAEVDRLGEEARSELIEQAKVLQASLQAIVDRVESVKSEHEKLEGGNKFLQSYIGELMQTSKITSTGTKKGKGRSGK